MELVLIAAISKNNVIGKDGKLPWDYTEDLKRFKKLTYGHAVLMGRKTYESILASRGKPLDDRVNFVLTSNKNYKVPDEVCLVDSIDTALYLCSGTNFICENNEDLYVIGGEKVYEATLPLADRLELTEIHKEFEGDAFFPSYDKSEWKEIKRENREEYSFVTYERILNKNKK